MEGVQVLYMFYERTQIQGLWIIAILVSLFALIISIAAESDWACGVSIVILGIFIWFTAWDVTSPFQQRFKVTIDESLTYQEFASRYEIINSEGEIYTIALKDPDQ